jgi:hypothetical protein
MTEPRKVFISYAHDDREIAAELATALTNGGVIPWFASEQLDVGASIRDEVRAAMEEADAFVVLVGRQPSAWSRWEWSEILKRAWKDEDTLVVPVLLSGAQPPGYLRDQQGVEVDPGTGSGLEQVIGQLQNPESRGIATSEEGRGRLRRRLHELERQAAELAGEQSPE